MSLQFDQETGKISYKGKDVGEHIFADGKSIVRLNLEYEGGEEWMVPLSHFAFGLKIIERQDITLNIESSEEAIQTEFNVPRFLIEKQVKRDGYVWVFHKNDADTWPSTLHGHDYDKGLTLDAISGNVYDVASRKVCKTLKAKHLQDIQDKLRQSDDFKDAVKALIDKGTAAS